MVAYPNPEGLEIHFAQLEGNHDLGDLWEAARAAGVKPGTIRVWESRGKVERVPLDGDKPLYHLPTIEAAAQVKPGRPKAA
ncbi:hypothetical protein [Streptomyces luteogriseus]|uniref:hypothetical protein n=1 Tax=Streptomyces luteogriseus TaxID=68233 RepID=UPI003796A3ED